MSLVSLDGPSQENVLTCNCEPRPKVTPVDLTSSGEGVHRCLCPFQSACVFGILKGQALQLTPKQNCSSCKDTQIVQFKISSHSKVSKQSLKAKFPHVLKTGSKSHKQTQLCTQVSQRHQLCLIKSYCTCSPRTSPTRNSASTCIEDA